MTPEQRSDLIGRVLIILALGWIAPSIPTISEATLNASEQFWREFQEACGK